MRLFRWATLPAVIAALFLPAFQASSRSVEPDYPCYLRDAAGRVINLTAMCTNGAIASYQPTASTAEQDTPAPQTQTANSGQVVETSREIKDNGSNSWTLSGKVQNQTRQSISEVSVVLTIQSGAEKQTQTTMISPSSLAVGAYGDFQVVVHVQDHRP